MTAILDERRFGVEIECGLPGGCDQAEELLYNAGGLRHWVEADERYDAQGFLHIVGGHVHEDGSGVEISSPILQGEQGLSELRRVFQILTDNGGYVTTLDGMHVHHDAPEFVDDREAVYRVVEMWAANQDNIDALVHHRRRDNGACPKDWNDDTITELKAGRENWRRGALNVRALQEHGTIEFRQHEGCLDFDTAVSWIKFGQSFLASALRREVPLLTCRTPKELLYRIRTDRMATAVLLSKNTEGEVLTPNEMSHDADRCYCDECYEARYSEDDGGW